MRIFPFLLAAAAACAATPAMAQTGGSPPLAFDGALKVATEAVRIARERKQPVSVVVVNREGRVIAALRMDGTSFVNLEVAEGKAVTAAALGVPTDLLEQAVDSGKPSFLAVKGLMPIGGGIALMRGGDVVAGVGVSGGAPVDDKAVAEAAAKAAGF